MVSGGTVEWPTIIRFIEHLRVNVMDFLSKCVMSFASVAFPSWILMIFCPAKTTEKSSRDNRLVELGNPAGVECTVMKFDLSRQETLTIIAALVLRTTMRS